MEEKQVLNGVYIEFVVDRWKIINNISTHK